MDPGLRARIRERAWDAVVVGAGPNGLAAALTLAEAGRAVLVLEAAATIGGGVRSAELTLPGFQHDVCSAIHPLALGSPFFRSLDLAPHGLAWVQPPAPLAHPLDDGSAVLLERSIDATAAGLGRDGRAWERLVGPLARDWSALAEDVLRPLLRWPRHPLLAARFGLPGLLPASALARLAFRGARARALFAGLSGHAIAPLESPGTAAVALVLGALAHAVGWPLPRGGAQRLADALAGRLRALGVVIETGARVETLDDLPPARATLLDVGPRQLLSLAGDRLRARERRALARYRYGPGAFKLDLALDGPIPWRAAECSRAACVHLGGTLEEIAAAEAAVARGQLPERPYVLLAQPTLFDPSRAPAGRHVAWAYCHVPNGCDADRSEAILGQIERFAPGFRDRILARHARRPADLERDNANAVGGDINGGAQDLAQLLARPRLTLSPYATGLPGLYLCSASTPPGGGVHGMCGVWAAREALARGA